MITTFGLDRGRRRARRVDGPPGRRDGESAELPPGASIESRTTGRRTGCALLDAVRGSVIVVCHRLIVACSRYPQGVSRRALAAAGMTSRPTSSIARRIVTLRMLKITCWAPASVSSPKRSTIWAGVSVRPRRRARPTSGASSARSRRGRGRSPAQCSARIAYLRAIASGEPKTLRRIGVLGDQAQRLPLAAAADHDRDAGPRERLRGVEQPRRMVVAAVEARPRCRARRSTSRGRSGASPRAARTARRAAGTGSRGASTRPRSRRPRSRARRDRRTGRRASSSP